jgi:PIN domain nuclease of toxin-antitoxin system
VKVLLDIHVLLWWLADDRALPARAAKVIAESETLVKVSAATAWEISVKKALGRLQAPDDLADALQANSFEPLTISLEHAMTAGALPPHHGDPFDRMLIAQAQVESLTLVTVNPRFAEYDVRVLPLT